MRGVDRRTVVVGLASLGGSAAILLSGCGPRSAAGDGDAAGSGRRDDDPTADERLVALALGNASFTLETVELTRKRHPRLRGVTGPALAAHQAHVRLLRGTSDVAPGRGGFPMIQRAAVPRQPQQALAVLAREEARLSRQLADLALDARSGALARVLASMAAASAQLEQVLAQASRGAGAGDGSGNAG